jgi:type IV pilus assembly protein PilY1
MAMYMNRLEKIRRRLTQLCARALLGSVMGAGLVQAVGAVTLADRPLFSVTNVPGNLMLALSVEWPTANTPAYVSTSPYAAGGGYLGYFDPAKCYSYEYNLATPAASYFRPRGAATSAACTSSTANPRWSGNYLNWAAMQSLDIFRWVLTGGDRVVDTTTETRIEKTRHSGQGERTSRYPDKVLNSGVTGATPFTWGTVVSRVHGLGTAMYFSDRPAVSCTFNTNNDRNTTFNCTTNVGGDLSATTGNNTPSAGNSTARTASASNPTRSMSCTVSRSSGGGGNSYTYNCNVTVGSSVQSCGAAATYAGNAANVSCSPVQNVVDYDGTNAPAAGNFYRVYMRVRACDGTVGFETNCKQYGSNYKPEGLMQEYALNLRYGAFGYLNDDSFRDGGVLRARMKSTGPLIPVPGSVPVANTKAEWSATTGILATNPDPTDAAGTQSDAAALGYTVNVGNSGVLNYLNRFGKTTNNDYKRYDPVTEMYYAATRYFRNLGNVASYSDLSGATDQAKLARWVDGFPVIRNWDDPIQYSCQKNFILGVGDVYTHRDRNVPGSTITSADEPAMPAEVAADTTVDATVANRMVQQLEGDMATATTAAITDLGTHTSGRNNSYYIVGLAYDAHTKDIRADHTGSQTISTYWLDVREAQRYENRNQFWLAAKYGGFTVPNGFDPYAATNSPTTLNLGMWSTTGDTLTSLTPTTDPRPDNYFLANNATALASGLRGAFSRIASENAAATSTAFSTTTSNTTGFGTGSYKTIYNPRGWTGDIVASELTFAADRTPTLSDRWSAAALLDASTPGARRIVTCCTSSGAALPFRYADLNAATLSSRTYFASFSNVPGVSSQSATNFVSYLRGDRAQELSGGGVYRTRSSRLGDIVGSRTNAVGKPSFPYADQFNAGYGAFKSLYANRKTVVYVGANDGMMHAFDGSLTGAGAGSELFAYIPSFVYGNSSTASTDGLAALGNPTYQHRYYVDGTAQNFDVDLRNTSGAAAGAPDWRTLIIGGLGKGGRGYYAIDGTDPASWTSETAVAGKVLWEFTDPDMGYSFAEPIVAKTAKYGWTVMFSSGYNNLDGKGYLFLVNPRNGSLLEKIATTEGSAATPLNMVHGAAFLPSTREFTAESVYAGDLRGNLWRFDLTAASGALPAPTKIASLTDSSGNAQPVTVRPRIAIDPSSTKRYVVIGTGRLLDDTDIADAQRQTLYAIADGTATSGGFYTSATLPTGVSQPVTRSALNNNSDPLTGIGSTPASAMGWYYDLVVAPNGVGERVTGDLDVHQGTVAAPINLPNGEACNPSGSGRAVVLRLADGRTTLVSTDSVTGTTTLVDSVRFTSIITNLQFFTNNGQTDLLVGTGAPETTGGSPIVSGPGLPPPCKGGASGVLGCNLEDPGAMLRRLNWREVQTSN